MDTGTIAKQPPSQVTVTYDTFGSIRQRISCSDSFIYRDCFEVKEQHDGRSLARATAGPAPARPPGISDAMWALLGPALALVQQGPPPQQNVDDTIRAALHAELTAYCVQVFNEGQTWAATCGAIFESTPAREMHWPNLRSRFPLLAVCAWFVLPALMPTLFVNERIQLDV